MNATGIMALEPLDEAIDHVRGPVEAPVILEYGDYECPWSRRAYREIDEAERQLAGRLRFAYRHFPLTEIHPHALGAAWRQRRRRTRASSGRCTTASTTGRRRLPTPISAPMRPRSAWM